MLKRTPIVYVVVKNKNKSMIPILFILLDSLPGHVICNEAGKVPGTIEHLMCSCVLYVRSRSPLCLVSHLYNYEGYPHLFTSKRIFYVLYSFL
jgi:hypothetical protein